MSDNTTQINYGEIYLDEKNHDFKFLSCSTVTNGFVTDALSKRFRSDLEHSSDPVLQVLADILSRKKRDLTPVFHIFDNLEPETKVTPSSSSSSSSVSTS